MSQSAPVSASNPPAPAAGSATKPRWDSRKRMSWPLRARRRARLSGRPSGERVRQDADAVGAAEAGREGRDRPAHDVHVRVARGHHPPRALGLDMRRPRLEPAGLLDPRPDEAKRAKLRQGDEFVRVGREAEGDHARAPRRAGAPAASSARRRPTPAPSAKASSWLGVPPAACTLRASATRSGPAKPLARSESAASTNGFHVRAPNRRERARTPPPRRDRVRRTPRNRREMRPTARSARRNSGPRRRRRVRGRVRSAGPRRSARPRTRVQGRRIGRASPKP